MLRQVASGEASDQRHRLFRRTMQPFGRSNKGSKQLAELIRCQSGGLGDAAHRDCVNWVVAWNGEAGLAVGHHDMSALAGNPVTELFKDADGVALADARNLRHTL